jgi:membrane associated rhomboid family serine protease
MERAKSHSITWLLIALNVVVFIMVFSMPEAMQSWVFQVLGFSGEGALGLWRWFTSLFMHVSASHLFFNMLGLYFFGKILEEEVSRQWFVSVYFASGLIGNFVFMLTSTAYVVGASGCVFGVMGAAMLLNPIKRVRLYLFPLPLGIIAILFLIMETLVVYFQPQEFSGVANVSHLAGVIAGSVFAFFYDWRRSSKGVLVLAVCIALLLVLSPIFSLITGIGGLVLGVIDAIIGLVLYTIAGLFSFIWV